MNSDEQAAPAPTRASSFAGTARAVAWSFFGVRKSGAHEQDAGQLNPVHVIIAGVVGAALFVAALVLLIDWVLASGVAR